MQIHSTETRQGWEERNWGQLLVLVLSSHSCLFPCCEFACTTRKIDIALVGRGEVEALAAMERSSRSHQQWQHCCLYLDCATCAASWASALRIGWHFGAMADIVCIFDVAVPLLVLVRCLPITVRCSAQQPNLNNKFNSARWYHHQDE